MTAPIIVTAAFAPHDLAWLDAERRDHFPAERNQVPAHLTLFHHLPPSAGDEIDGRLREEARAPKPVAAIAGLLDLGGGVAYRVQSDALNAIRTRLAESFAGLLIPQDLAQWRPHVTIQNKVAPAEARHLLQELQAGFRPRPLTVTGLATWWYRGGPWEPRREFRFRG